MNYDGGETVQINGADRYIRLRSFVMHTPTLTDLTDAELLQQVIQKPEFDSLFVGTEDSEDVGSYQGRGIHGPFDLAMMSPELYERISASEFHDDLRRHYADPFYIQEDGPVSPEKMAAVDQVVNPIVDRASRIFRLTINRGSEEYLSEGRVHSDFDEYLFVEDRTNAIHFFIVAVD